MMSSVATHETIGDIEVDIFRMKCDPEGHADFTLKWKKDRDLFELIKILCISYHLIPFTETSARLRSIARPQVLEYGDSDDRTFEVNFNCEVDFYHKVFKPKVEELLLKHHNNKNQDVPS